MLTRLDILNYQRHGKLRIDLDPAVTTIVGESDSGKSSIIRALRWLAFNRPRGESFIRDGQRTAAVRLTVDGHKIERRRGPGRNTYAVDGKRLEAFGADVPERVSGLLNLGPENFQGQHDMPFWFGLTPGEVAKRLNAVVDLAAIDDATSDLASRLRRSKAEESVVEGRLAEAETELDGLAHVPELDAELRDLETLHGEQVVREAQAAAVAALAGQAESYGEVAERAGGAVLDGLAVVSLAEKAAETAGEADALEGLVGRAIGLRESTRRPVPNTCGIDCLKDRAEKAASGSALICGLVDRALVENNKMDEAYNGFEKAMALLVEETGGLCPVCGGPLI